MQLAVFSHFRIGVPPARPFTLARIDRAAVDVGDLLGRERREAACCREGLILLIRVAESQQRYIRVERECVVQALGHAQARQGGACVVRAAGAAAPVAALVGLDLMCC